MMNSFRIPDCMALLTALRPMVAMTLDDAREAEAHERDVMYCQQDVLNACWDGRPDDVAGRHWSGLGPACPECNLRAALAVLYRAEVAA